MTFVRKMTQSAAVFAVTTIMSWGGFVSGAEVQSDGAINTLAMVLGVGTVGVLLAGIWVSTRFRLNSATHDVLMAEIDRLKSGDTTAPTPETRAIVEDLTGWKYEQLWGNNPVGRVQLKEQIA
jgi:oligogalacturonide transporter